MNIPVSDQNLLTFTAGKINDFAKHFAVQNVCFKQNGL